MSEPFIRTENLQFSYEDEVNQTSVPALRGLDISIRQGEYVAVLGHNGSGKSTFAKLLNLILTPTGGVLHVAGKTVTADALLTEDEIFDVRRNVGMVFQNPDNQLVATLVEEDVAFGPENLGIPREEIRIRVDEALEMVGMTEYAHHAPHKLSGGQKQRVAIAGVIAMMPKCIIFDESTAMLDPMGRKEVTDTMERLNRTFGITVLHITHYMDEAARSDRVVIMNDGTIFHDDTPEAVFSHVEELREVGLEVPQGTELLHMLARDGFAVREDCITVEACTDELYRIITENKVRQTPTDDHDEKQD